MWEPSAEKDREAAEVRIRPFDYVTDTAEILSFMPELYESNFPGFVVDVDFMARRRNQLRAAARDPSQMVLVAEDPLGLCGFIWLVVEQDYRHRRRGEVSAIYVHPRMRGRGVGRRLMEAGEEYLRSSGCHSVMLMVTAANQVALGLYESLGYEITRHQMEKRLPRGGR
ncbi:GNAT family N-acetyltransferase [Symbiobacterium thermophilum]|uniref:GNAT family N-acetyltransferase n=1 Tax=Symbiobacterium thermophilum TaxID=2734 RepID=UPI0035C7713F